MSITLQFHDAAADELSRVRRLLETELEGMNHRDAYLALHMDFEELLIRDHRIGEAARVVLFRPLEAIAEYSDKVDYLLHMAATYVVARGHGLIAASGTNPARS
jgi:hypothetical protein